jgi:hypothetical protein
MLSGRKGAGSRESKSLLPCSHASGFYASWLHGLSAALPQSWLGTPFCGKRALFLIRPHHPSPIWQSPHATFRSARTLNDAHHCKFDVGDHCIEIGATFARRGHNATRNRSKIKLSALAAQAGRSREILSRRLNRRSFACATFGQRSRMKSCCFPV